MAEALARLDFGEAVELVSGGAYPTGWVHPNAIAAMADLGVDISDAESNTALRYIDQDIDLVVMLCDAANRVLPNWPKAREGLRSFVDDPTWATSTEEERLTAFRKSRDEIRELIGGIIEERGWTRG